MSSAIMQYLDWQKADRKFYLIDTFAGPVFSQYSGEEVAADRLEVAKQALETGGYVTDLTRVRNNYAEWPNAVVVPEAVPDILPTVGFGKVAFLHIDMNCAYPEVSALEFFWDRLSPGAVVLFDDYTFFGYEHQSPAIDAVLKRLNADVLCLPTGQGVVVK